MSETYLYTMTSNTQDGPIQLGSNPSQYRATDMESGPQRHQTSIMKTTHIYMILLSI